MRAAGGKRTPSVTRVFGVYGRTHSVSPADTVSGTLYVGLRGRRRFQWVACMGYQEVNRKHLRIDAVISEAEGELGLWETPACVRPRYPV